MPFWSRVMHRCYDRADQRYGDPVIFTHTNSQPSPIVGWLRHSRQIAGWGTDPNPAQAWLAHVRSVLAQAQ
jgi:hypothetical protein